MGDTSFEFQKLSYRIDEAVRASGPGRSFIYERIASGELKSIKVGGRRLIFHADLIDFLNGAGAPIPIPASCQKSARSLSRRPKLSPAGPVRQMEFPWISVDVGGHEWNANGLC